MNDIIFLRNYFYDIAEHDSTQYLIAATPLSLPSNIENRIIIASITLNSQMNRANNHGEYEIKSFFKDTLKNDEIISRKSFFPFDMLRQTQTIFFIVLYVGGKRTRPARNDLQKMECKSM